MNLLTLMKNVSEIFMVIILHPFLSDVIFGTSK